MKLALQISGIAAAAVILTTPYWARWGIETLYDHVFKGEDQ